MTESELYQREIKPMLKKMGLFFYRIDYKRLPDLYISKNGKVLWCELKCVNKVKKIIKPNWRPGQLAWIKEHELKSPGTVCLLLNYCGKIYFLPPKESYKKEELVCQKKIYLKKIID